MGVYNLSGDSIVRYASIAKYSIGSEGGEWLAILHHKDFKLSEPEGKKKKKKKKKNKGPKVEEKGQVLRLYHPKSGKEHTFKGVKEYSLGATGSYVAWISSKTYNDTIDSVFVYRFNLKEESKTLIWSSVQEAVKIHVSHSGNETTFLASQDTGKVKVHGLYLAQGDVCTMVVDSISNAFETYHSVYKESAPYFSKSGKRLFFRVNTKPRPEPEDTLTKDEKYHLDLWSWTDGKLQPQQLKEEGYNWAKGWQFVYHIESKELVQLSDSLTDRAVVKINHDLKYGYLRTQKPYEKLMTWDDWYYDVYRVDIETGERELMAKKQNGKFSMAPNGMACAYYVPGDSIWHVLNMETGKVITIEQPAGVKFYRLNHDLPALPDAAGGWAWGPDASYGIVGGQYDYWKVDLKSGKLSRLTFGKETNRVYTIVKFDKDKLYVDVNKPLYLTSINRSNFDEGFGVIQGGQFEVAFEEPYKIWGMAKAKYGERTVLRQMSFIEYPEIQISDVSFKERKTVSATNLQQKEYNWGTVEHTTWTTYSGDTMKGLLYKPENFDPNKKYPLMVYFYELYSHDIHYHYLPKPTASIVYPTEYVSNGYIVFIPDVKYKVGYPARGAFNCIVSGTDALVEKYDWIDSTRMALQGQSWGGYQTAQLVTMTNKYKCAMAGAPVSNMFSAFGGIRWGSGLSRAFQYEKTQSRIGATIWDAPELYRENSPVFHLPKVETPLLIMHNDGDGAVPWYQGIELFCGLRRLGKETWMLNYNKDQHNLTKLANKRDLSRRMRQFF